jgi:hypothetical protein
LRYWRNPTASWEEVHNGITVTSEEGAVYYMDEIGASVWRLLEQPSTVPDVVDAFAEAFADVSPDRLREDLGSFVEQMVDEGLAVSGP